MLADEKLTNADVGGPAPAGAEPGTIDLNPLLDAMLDVRGATAAAVVTSDGEVLASRSVDRALLERTVEIVTSALAAAQALGDLLGESEDGSGPEQVTLIFGEGPIVLRPVPAAKRVLVLALEGEQDLGRARLMLRGMLGRLAESTLTGR